MGSQDGLAGQEACSVWQCYLRVQCCGKGGKVWDKVRKTDGKDHNHGVRGVNGVVFSKQEGGAGNDGVQGTAGGETGLSFVQEFSCDIKQTSCSCKCRHFYYFRK